MLQPTKAVSWVKAKFSPGIKTKEADPAELQKLLWMEVEANLRQYLKALIESMLKTELEAYLGAERYERSEGRKDYRNGTYARTLATKHGTVEDVRVPRTRSGDFEPKVFERYGRRTKNVDTLIGALFLNGISTRKLEKVAKELLGVEVTHSTIGHIAGEISAKDCLQFQEKELKDEYRFLFLDGISAHIREIGVERGVLLCAVALRHDGTKEIIGARLADAESEKDWTAFLINLKTRGLAGKNLELVTTDGGPGCIAALKTIYPFKKHQRCIAHQAAEHVLEIKNEYQGRVYGRRERDLRRRKSHRSDTKIPCMENGVAGAGRERSALPGEGPARVPDLHGF